MTPSILTAIRVQLAKKLGTHEAWKSTSGRVHLMPTPSESTREYWLECGDAPSDETPTVFRRLPSLYDLCQEGEARLTEEQQRKYIEKLCSDVDIACLCEHGAYWPELFAAIRLSNLPERAKALCECLP